jgi:hypothetical protein
MTRNTLIDRNYSRKAIDELKNGDYFIDGNVVSIADKFGYITIVTDANGVYNAHIKPDHCTLYKRLKLSGSQRRRLQRKTEKAQQRGTTSIICSEELAALATLEGYNIENNYIPQGVNQ